MIIMSNESNPKSLNNPVKRDGSDRIYKPTCGCTQRRTMDPRVTMEQEKYIVYLSNDSACTDFPAWICPICGGRRFSESAGYLADRLYRLPGLSKSQNIPYAKLVGMMLPYLN